MKCLMLTKNAFIWSKLQQKQYYCEIVSPVSWALGFCLLCPYMVIFLSSFSVICSFCSSCVLVIISDYPVYLVPAGLVPCRLVYSLRSLCSCVSQPCQVLPCWILLKTVYLSLSSSPWSSFHPAVCALWQKYYCNLKYFQIFNVIYSCDSS